MKSNKPIEFWAVNSVKLYQKQAEDHGYKPVDIYWRTVKGGVELIKSGAVHIAGLTLTVLDKEYSIHRLKPEDDIPRNILGTSFYSISKTGEELSIICESDITINSNKVDAGWSCLKALGPLDISLTGVLAGISTVLAEASISIFAISTYDTDYILVKTKELTKGIKVLETAGYVIK